MQEKTSLMIKKIKEWIAKNKVSDVIIFGSVARGKTEARDIDLCIVINDKDEQKSLDLVHSLGKLTDSNKIKAHINIISAGSFVSGSTLAKTLLNEGYSIKKNKSFASTLGFENKSLFTYNLTDFSPSKRVQFHYLLRGRYGSEGILNEVHGKIIGTGSILIPKEKEEILKDVLDKWNVKYSITPLLIS